MSCYVVISALMGGTTHLGRKQGRFDRGGCNTLLWQKRASHSNGCAGERTKEERSAAARKGAETRKRRAAEAAAGQNGKAKSNKKAK